MGHGYLPEEIHTILNISPRSVRHWANNLMTHGHVLPSLNPTRGQRHTLNAIHMYGLIGIIEASPAMYLDELQDWLALEYDILISKQHCMTTFGMQGSVTSCCAGELCRGMRL